MLFYGIINPGKLNIFPPPGTNIMGAYDAAIARSKGAIPRTSPAQRRTYWRACWCYHSWGVTSMLNTLVSPLSQGECLRILSAPPELEKRLSGLRAGGPGADARPGGRRLYRLGQARRRRPISGTTARGRFSRALIGVDEQSAGAMLVGGSVPAGGTPQ